MTRCWKKSLRENFTSWDKLADFLLLDDIHRARLLYSPSFPLLLPLRLAKRIKKRTLDDPILKQFLPVIEEQRLIDGFVTDPVGDDRARLDAKLLHKYEGRVLLVCTSVCAMHCRYCFRRHFSYNTKNRGFSREIEKIQQDSSIREVILSGGDPLSLSNDVLHFLLQELSLISHVKRVRFHTRFVVGIPERIDEEFLQMIDTYPKQIWMVIHVNHPKELGEDLFVRLRKLQRLGVVMLNQSVLLKGINDDADILQELFEELVDHGIIPYYLHQLDKVQGAAHFYVKEEKGRLLIECLKDKLPGFAVPKYVKEIAGMLSKQAV